LHDNDDDRVIACRGGYNSGCLCVYLIREGECKMPSWLNMEFFGKLFKLAVAIVVIVIGIKSGLFISLFEAAMRMTK